MTLRVSSNPYGYKKLLVYKKADELQFQCAKYIATFPREKTLIALADQMNRSARSVKQNIVEGWKRNSTKEYYNFLGFSIGANAELEEDCDDIIRGIYEMGVGGLGKGVKGKKGEEWDIERVEQLPFYPIDPRLPTLVQLKLRCKELNFLLKKLQDSLHNKMGKSSEGSMRSAWGSCDLGKGGEETLHKMIDDAGLARLPDGRLVSKKVASK